MPSMPVGTTLNSNTLALGVSREYWMAYERGEADAMNGNLGKMVMDIEGKSDHAKLAYYNSAPIPALWRRSEAIAGMSFFDVGWTIQVKEWAREIRWRWTDEQDDQTQSLVPMAQGVGKGFWVRDQSNFFQLLNNSTDTSGLDAIPNAADGVALFSATDGAGAARFGVTGGNIVSGQNFASGSGLRAGFQQAVSRMLQFQDTVGQPLFPEFKNFLVIGAAADLQAWNEAFHQTIALAAPSTSTSNAGVSSVLVDAGYNITPWITQRVATGVMFVISTDAPVKPLIRVNRQRPSETPITLANDSEARKYGNVGLHYVSRTGYGIGLPYQAIKVTT